MKRSFFLKWFLILLTVLQFAQAETFHADIVVYGATPSGIIAAVQASRMGKKVYLIEASRWIGGMVSGGLSSTDVGFPLVISGTTQEFFDRTYQIEKDRKPSNRWNVEPHVATKVFYEMLSEVNIAPHLETRLIRVNKTGTQITSIETNKNDEYIATQYIDSSYEGDLMAMAGVSYTWGRESRSTYNEPDAGVQKPTLFVNGAIDPYIRKDEPWSGLLFSMTQGPVQAEGSSDRNIMAYNYRHCATNKRDRAIPYSNLIPSDYHPNTYEGVRRTLDYLRSTLPERSGEDMARWFFSPQRKKVDGKDALEPYANDKFDINGGSAFGSDVVLYNQLYPNPVAGQSLEDFENTRNFVRKKIANYNLGLFHFLATDQNVPPSVQEFINQFGACSDEFTDNNNFPTQLYVREARRMIGEYVMTEKNVLLQKTIEDPIALDGYNVDTHNHQLLNIDGDIYVEGHKNAEGYVTSQTDFCAPYGISFGALKPKANEVTNLLVSVTVSASAVANGSLRLEPQYMMMGQAAGTAASLAVNNGNKVQDVDYNSLRKELINNKQRLDVIQDYMLQKVCVDPTTNHIQYGKTPLDPTCSHKRQIQLGERLPYHLGKSGIAIANCENGSQFIKVKQNVSLMRVLDPQKPNEGVTRVISTEISNHDICSLQPALHSILEKAEVIGADKEFGFKLGEWKNNGTENGLISGTISRRCSFKEDGKTPDDQRTSRRYFRQNVLGRTVILPEGTQEAEKMFYTTRFAQLPELDSPCPSTYQPTLTLWVQDNFQFGASNEKTVGQASLISDQYVEHSSPELGFIMERSYLAKDFGKLRNESWRREDWKNEQSQSAKEIAKKLYESKQCNTPYRQKDRGSIKFHPITTDQGAYAQIIFDASTQPGGGQHTWYMTECEDFSNITIAKNPVGDLPSQGPKDKNAAAPKAKFWDFWAR